MVKLGLMADLHGNLEAVKFVWADMQEAGVEELAVAGDIVGVMGWPDETVEWVQKHADYVVLGNHDAYVVERYGFVPYHASQKQEHEFVNAHLTEESLAYLESLPEVVELPDGGIMGHAHPYEEPHTGYPADNYVDKAYWTRFASEHLEHEYAVMGHTHVQGGLHMDKFDGLSGTIVNPGTLGAYHWQDARWALIDTKTKEFELRRTFYDEGPVKERFDMFDLLPASKLNKTPTY